VSDMYARTDLIMAGKWDSALGPNSPFPPELFKPRVAIWANADDSACGVDTFCAGGQPFPANPPLEAIGQEFEQPLGGALVNGQLRLEALGIIKLEAFADAELLTHEFGHVVDYFAKPGLMSSGFSCMNCASICAVGTTDEVGSLMESWAQFASLW